MPKSFPRMCSTLHSTGRTETKTSGKTSCFALLFFLTVLKMLNGWHVSLNFFIIGETENFLCVFVLWILHSCLCLFFFCCFDLLFINQKKLSILQGLNLLPFRYIRVLSRADSIFSELFIVCLCIFSTYKLFKCVRVATFTQVSEGEQGYTVKNW